jgi:hypothetical protein
VVPVAFRVASRVASRMGSSASAASGYEHDRHGRNLLVHAATSGASRYTGTSHFSVTRIWMSASMAALRSIAVPLQDTRPRSQWRGWSSVIGWGRAAVASLSSPSRGVR